MVVNKVQAQNVKWDVLVHTQTMLINTYVYVRIHTCSNQRLHLADGALLYEHDTRLHISACNTERLRMVSWRRGYTSTFVDKNLG